jgi:ion channel
VLRFFRDNLLVITGVTASLVCSISYVNLGGNWTPDKARSYFPIALLVGAWLFTYVWASWASIVAIIGAFGRREKSTILSRILISYASLILMFTGLYYSMAFRGDLSDAISKYTHYRHEGQLVRAGLRSRVRLLLEDRRAFRGIRERMWSGVDWPKGKTQVQEGYPPEEFEVSLNDSLALSRRGIKDVVRFIPEARADVFADCLHFSIVTMATLGYGDIVPHSRSVKLTSDFQVISGLVLLVVALGMTLGDWWKAQKPSDAAVPQKKSITVWVILLIFLSASALAFGWQKFYGENNERYLSWFNATSVVYQEARQGLSRKAREHAEIALLVAPQYRSNWNYGNAIHDANTALGIIALRDGNLREAKRRLLEAGSTPGSPQLNSAGPRMFLARELLLRGETDAVLRYLELCRLFWKMDRGLLSEWTAQLRKGRLPDLVNLRKDER